MKPIVVPFDPDMREVVQALFEGYSDPIDIQLALIERYGGGEMSFDLVDALFRAHGWEWPEQ